MADKKDQHGHAGSHDNKAGHAAEEGMMFPFLVVLALVVVIGWLTQPGPATTVSAEPATPAAVAPHAAQPAALEQATPQPPPRKMQQPAPPQIPEPAVASEVPETAKAPPAPGAPLASAVPQTPPSAAPAAPSAAPAPAATGAAAFDRIAALTALGKSGQGAGHCRRGGASGNAKVVVTFDPDGHVSRARMLSAKYVGTPTGKCVLDHLRQTTVAPFSGGKPRNVLTSVHVY